MSERIIEATEATFTIDGKTYPMQVVRNGLSLSGTIKGPKGFWKWLWFRWWTMRRRKVSVSMMIEPEDMKRLGDFVESMTKENKE